MDRLTFQEDEIDLKALFIALSKQKKFISVFTVIFIFIGLVLSMILPDTYRINVLLKVPEILDRKGDIHTIQEVEPVEFIEKKIEEGVFSPSIAKKFSLEDVNLVPKFDVRTLPGKNGYIEITVNTTRKNLQRDSRILEYLVVLLKEEYEPYIRDAGELWEKIIFETKKHSDSLIQELKSAVRQKDFLVELEKEFANGMKKYSKESKDDLGDREQNNNELGKEGIYLVLDALYRVKLGNLLKELDIGISNLSSRIMSIKKSIKESKIELATLSYQKSYYIHNFEEIQPVVASAGPVGPNRDLIFIMTSLLGFVLAICIALIRDTTSN